MEGLEACARRGPLEGKRLGVITRQRVLPAGGGGAAETEDKVFGEVTDLTFFTGSPKPAHMMARAGTGRENVSQEFSKRKVVKRYVLPSRRYIRAGDAMCT